MLACTFGERLSSMCRVQKICIACAGIRNDARLVAFYVCRACRRAAYAVWTRALHWEMRLDPFSEAMEDMT